MLDIKKFKEQIDEYVYYLNDDEGRTFYLQLNKDKVAINKIYQDNDLYFSYITLQFLLIPHISNEELFELFKKFLVVGLRLEDIDLTERLKKKLIFTDINDRDDLKNEIKNILKKNTEVLTKKITVAPGKEMSLISEWLRDYTTETNQSADILNKMQYFFQRPFVAKMFESDRQILRKLIALYDFVNRSSLTPEGFEDDILIMTEDGKIITTDHGNPITLYDPNVIFSTPVYRHKARTVSGPPQTSEERKINELRQIREEYAENDIEKLALKEEIESKKKIEDLKILANRFKDGSLQRRAIEEEIKKLEL